MAAAIKKEILQDEERKQRRTAVKREHDEDHQMPHNGHHGHMECDEVEVQGTNGHGNGLCENSKESEKDALDEDEKNAREEEFRTHFFLASVHQQQHQQESPTNDSLLHVPCPLCQVPLEQRVFRQHLDRHYPRDSPVCPVIQCGRRFAHPNSVRNHMRLKHAVQWLKMKAMRSSGGPFTGTQADLAISSTSNNFTKKEFL